MLLAVDLPEQAPATDVERTAVVLRHRLDRLGLDGAVVDVQRPDRISVHVPATADPERVSRLLRTTGALELRLVRFPEGAGGSNSREAVLERYGGALPPELELLSGEKRDRRGKAYGRLYYAVERESLITGEDFRGVRPSVGALDQPVVAFSLRPEAAEPFREATSRNIGSCLAIVYDGRVVSAPVINAPIGEDGIIEGGFTQQEVEDLADVLGAGRLPVHVTVLEQRILRASPEEVRRATLLRTGGFALAVLAFAAYVVGLVVYGRRKG